MPRVQRRFLLHSRWTAIAPTASRDGQRHFEVVAVIGDLVTLRAVLTRYDHQLAIAALEDPATWALGWQSIPATP
ncbi:MAG: TIGR02450 family Trp-rich protein [Deltaproteobacteria bacterium]|nr:TIGR02450 family Trp-rich protein [Deltaproteobacteria bacterium]